MSKTAGISDAEWLVMQVLWGTSPRSAQDVCNALADQVEWHPKTVRTLLGRLVKKKVVSREKKDGTYRFFPLVSEEACVREEGNSFLQRYFSGKAMPMLAHFIAHEQLAPDDVKALRAMLNRKLKDERGHE